MGLSVLYAKYVSNPKIVWSSLRNLNKYIAAGKLHALSKARLALCSISTFILGNVFESRLILLSQG